MFAMYSKIQTATPIVEIHESVGEVRSSRGCFHLAEFLYEANASGTRIQVSHGGGATLHAPRRSGCDAGRTVASSAALFPLCWTTGEDQRRRNVVSCLPSLRAC